MQTQRVTAVEGSCTLHQTAALELKNPPLKGLYLLNKGELAKRQF